MKIIILHGADEKAPAAVERIREAVEFVSGKVRLKKLITQVRIAHSANIHARAFYNPNTRDILMNAEARCFHPDYRGWKYKTFGGIKDLTPRGIFCHELGHAADWWQWFHLKNRFMLKEFQILRRQRTEAAVSGYAKSHPEEDLAEAFRLFVSNGKSLKKICPVRYGILKRHTEEHLR